MPGRTETPAISYKEVDSVSESSESSSEDSEDEEDHELKARLEASGAPLVKRKRTKKKRKSSDKSRKRRRQEGSRSRASKRADPDDGDEDETPWSGDEGARGRAGHGASDHAEGLQATNLLGTLPFELICEIFSYLDLGDLVHLARTSPTLNVMLLAPSAQSIWSRSRRNAGYVIFPGMSEIKFALMMEGSLCQCCGAKGELEMMWMARLCKDCMKERAGPLHELSSDLSRHEQLLFCVESVTGAWNGWRRDFYTFIELETTNTALHEAQTADDAEKPARLATGVPETEQHPSRVQQYVADRKRLLADRSKTRKINESAGWPLRDTERRELRARRKLGICAREGRTLEILRALQDRHGWTLQEVAELEVHLFRDEHDSAFTRGVPDVPQPLPDHAPLVWKHFKPSFLLAQSELRQLYTYDFRYKETQGKRADFAQSSYETCAPALAIAFRMPVDALPAWKRLRGAPEVESLCQMPLTFLQTKPSAEYQDISERTARPMVEEDRMNAIRYALAAHLDIPPAKLSCDPADYPASKFNKLFLDRVINRFTVEGSEYLTYHEALATGHTGRTVSQMTRAAWRRAIAHVLGAAKIKDTERSLDKLDALGAGFRWTNGPRGYKGRAYTWRKMVDLLLRQGPTGLHLTDLRDVHLAYNRPRNVSEKDKNASTSANKLVEAEGGKTSTTSSSDCLEADDMETDDTTADGSSMTASTPVSSPGTAATATATSSPAPKLRRSTRLAPAL